MRLTGGLIAGFAAVLAATPAPAQTAAPVADPIGDLLRQRAIDPEEPDTAAAGNSRVDPDPVPGVRSYVRPPAPVLTRPVYVDETGRNPDAPPSPADVAYDSRLKASAASARGFQGPMDGGWTLSVGGRDRYALQLIDRNGVVEGAWRDLRRAGALEGSGFIDAVERAGVDVTFRFAGGAVAVLHAAGERWTGDLTEGGRTEAATLAKRVP
ncbi:MAG: hypothetical protein JNL41_09205 [Phenylobacterium sp.]|uniref:hypothetical protein n=1 Tax=Phenylobacterium sp. TaxID=1871053 RepID=UPI001A4042B4|nr:hypothetical protein [Phenylobacterium sp.]MBL8554442.1 hypothetical protein [Phenylobacterium sp.]